MTYPDKLEILPLLQPPHATINVPGSKSITNRALVLAALSAPGDGSDLRGALKSEDTELMIDALRVLGFGVQVDWETRKIQVCRKPNKNLIPNGGAKLFVGNSGTTMRFLTALVSLGYGQFSLDGVSRMRERPMQDLLSALQQLGVDATSDRGNGYPPIIVKTRNLCGGTVMIGGSVSSQFISALLMVAPLASEPVSIRISGPLVSQPYVEMTVEMMMDFGVEVDTDFTSYFNIPKVEWYEAIEYDIEPDATAASYFLAAAAIGQGKVRIPNLHVESIQGDVRFITLLGEMGSRIVEGSERLCVQGHPLRGIDVDMNDISDTVMTLAAVACFAEGPTTIRNVAHIRHKETDRITALATELRRVGAEVEEFADGLKITPRPLHGAEIETYNDHRMAMSMALIGLKVPGIVIKNPGCVAKTYPGFWDDLEKLRG